MRAWIARTLVVACALLALGAADARAARTAPVQKAIWGPLTVLDGNSAFPIYRRLGVDVWQFQLSWRDIATRRPEDPENPDDPAYRWLTSIDDAVAEANANGIDVALLVRGTPPWANGDQTRAWAPTDPADYGHFLVAASRRFPTVRRWMIWGEPTRQGSFRPMPANDPLGPRTYARLLDTAYGALKQADPRNVVIGGMTFTAGLVTPADFIRWMRLPDGTPPRLDLYGHNPFSTRFPDLGQHVYVDGLRDINDLDRLHRDLRRAYRGRPTPKIWASEFTVSSDRGNRAFNFGVTRRQQAKWLTAAYALANSTSYVEGLGWFNLQDEPDDGSEVGLTTGLIGADGLPKPSYYAYRRVR